MQPAALGVDADTAAKKLARWAAEGWRRRVRRGSYIGVPVDAADPAASSEDALIVATKVWAPCYFTGWTAAGHWALTDQSSRTTVRIRASAVRLLDQDYLVHHVPEDALARGVEDRVDGRRATLLADPARTVIDILAKPAFAGGIRHGAEILSAYLDDHDPSLFIEHGDRLGNGAVFKRLGYLVEALAMGDPALISACGERVSSGASTLDLDGPPGRRSCSGSFASMWPS